MNDISIFSFFSGSGFLDLGFEKSNFDICFVNELRKSFLNAYKYSRSKLGILSPKYGYSGESIEDYLSGQSEAYLKSCIAIEKQKRRIIGFIGGPPCPDFSVGGKNRGRNGDNGKLSGIYVDLICQNEPDFFIFENVKGLWRTKRHREFFEELKSKLDSFGYTMTEHLVNSLEYGVPQDRDRIILFGVKKTLFIKGHTIEDFNWDSKKLYKKQDVFNLPWPEKTPFMQNASLNIKLPKELTVAYWFEKNNVDHHPNSKDQFKPRAGLEKFLRIYEGDDSKKSYKRLHRNRYSPTVCYGNNEVHLHPTLPRRISVAEALALQSLPVEFELPHEMSLTDKFKTIGNGVPFLLSKAIAETIYNFLKNNLEDIK
jgi:DNA (cytosine-5)-methyltransferase 1